MLSAEKQKLHGQLDQALANHMSNVRGLHGLDAPEKRLVFIDQVVDSIRRVEYAKTIASRAISAKRADPNSKLFDPLKAAAWHRMNGDLDEASWLVFLATHFGKNRKTHWRLARDIYGALGQKAWTWDRIFSDPEGVTTWLRKNFHSMQTDGVARNFGNHRKYETNDPSKQRSTGFVVESYVAWVAEHGSHHALFAAATHNSNGDRKAAFQWLFERMKVLSFGRMGKFDYLTMLSKLDIAAIEANSAYIANSTGPLKGSKLLLSGDTEAGMSGQSVDVEIAKLAASLGVGMQEIEDAICNWQKSPNEYKHFRG